MRFPTLAGFVMKRKMMKRDRPTSRLGQPIASNQLGRPATLVRGCVRRHLWSKVADWRHVGWNKTIENNEHSIFVKTHPVRRSKLGCSESQSITKAFAAAFLKRIAIYLKRRRDGFCSTLLRALAN